MSITFEKISIELPENISKEDFIDAKKRISKITKDANSTEVDKLCKLCGVSVSSYCNSHTIPQFILKQLSVDGFVITGISTLNKGVSKPKSGINETLTFRCICEKCDNTKFQSYENPDKYGVTLTQEMIRQIAMKNYLRIYDKSKISYSVLKQISKECQSSDIEKRISIEAMNLNDYSLLIDKIDKTEFYIIDDLVLDYMTPIAFQGVINLLVDFDGNIVNNLYNTDPKYKIQNLHLSVFPNKGKTNVTLFIRDGEKRYRTFYKRFKKLDISKKMYALNYIILLYSEDWALNPIFDREINNETLVLIQSTTNVNIDYIGVNDLKTQFSRCLDVVKKRFMVPIEGTLFNFLDEKNKM